MKKIYVIAIAALTLMGGAAYANEVGVDVNANTTVSGTMKPARPMMRDGESKGEIKAEARMKVMADNKGGMLRDSSMPSKMMRDSSMPNKMMRESSISNKGILKNKLMNLKDEHGQWKMKVVERLNAAITRMTTLITRLDSRIAKLKADGINTTVAEGHVAKAKANIELAKTKITAIKAIMDADTQAAAEIAANAAASIDDDEIGLELNAKNDARKGEIVKKIMPLAKEVNKLIIDAHKQLNLAVKALREVTPKKEKSENPTTTTTTPSTTQQ